jgi:hypothetical protein
MARKFIQMGMTRAKRYANYEGGRKYVGGKEEGVRLKRVRGIRGRRKRRRRVGVLRGIGRGVGSMRGMGG